MPSFNDIPLQSSTRAVLASMEISEPTPIQAESIPALLAGKDLVGQSATGSGKTLAYSLPIIERLAKNRRVVQALVLVPTRELAVQVNNVLSRFASSRRLTTALLVGGRPYGSQISALRFGAQIVVGTPGRVQDHLEQGTLMLDELRMCVLDEADQMLDSGFGPVIEGILADTPDTRQMALFSATMPEWVAKIEKKFLKEPVRVTIKPAKGAESTIEQIAYQVSQDQKMAALCTLLQSTEGESSLIFGRTKYGVEKLGKQLSKLGYMVGTLHGNKSQRAREDVLMAFRRGHVQTLLATDVAARGLDIKGIHQVINYELPESSELFTHRIGRTGRMGRQGKAITLLSSSDMPKWRRMARNLGQVVALQRLAISDDATTPRVIEKPVVPTEPEREQHSEPRRPARGGRRPFAREREGFASSRQERDDFVPPVREDRPTPTANRQQRRERMQQEIATWQAETFSPSTGKRRGGRRDAESRVETVSLDEAPYIGKGRRAAARQAAAWQVEGYPLPERPYVERGRESKSERPRFEKRRESKAELPRFEKRQESQSERPHFEKRRDSRRDAGHEFMPDMVPTRRKAQPFEAAEKRQSATRSKPGTFAAGRGPRKTAPKRSVSR
ncbi:DEAD/DEAH box helicase [Ktedonospora formicarum]|uniref:DEAD/DEAH box helicase n=1 Tax=Ktedonospora formicarum TaxID=2778364 RepID=A0A8J3MTQ5_9CHLR|nr:DEAD/DEAH box helicase [Ktedonospora formicarum]GHO46166.1 hypothetical protein KSX_43290 [Ktedonospora formicarum]